MKNKSGRSAVEVKSVVDCTGDADVAYLAGAECAKYSYKKYPRCVVLLYR
ncbi:MAG: FAD-dependent oxidoreductase [Clostridiales bacterium]|nr:MAG: FAD-dependent oxidoreductase [Clostridiales bacterium]